MAKPSIGQQEIYVKIWSQAVETQMHFNEMSVKARQFGLAFVAAALGLGIVLLRSKEEFTLHVPFPGDGFDLHVTVLIAVASAAALAAVMVLDLYVYHPMLRGAVRFNEDFERNYMSQIFSLEKGLTEAITYFSRHPDADINTKSDGKYEYVKTRKKKQIKARSKLALFYWLAIGMLVAVAVVLFVVTNFGKKPPQTGSSIPASPQQHPAQGTAASPPLGVTPPAASAQQQLLQGTAASKPSGDTPPLGDTKEKPSGQ